MTHSRITIFAGHYGSGKTSLAVNYAMALKRENPGKKVALADLDIVNPYFRSLDSRGALGALGIEMIAPLHANTNLESPSMPSGAMRLFDDKACLGIIDLGGDERGALAIGAYAELVRAEGAAVLLVCNKYRPLSREAGQALAVKNEIESAAHIRFTGIVNNSNLGAATTPEDIAGSFGYINMVSSLCGLPVVFTSVKRELIGKIPGGAELFPISLFGKSEWSI